MTAAPIVKWVGGKTRLLPELVARAPSSFGTYYEPFAGGAALFWRLAPKLATLSDLNHQLIGTYAAVRDDVDGVITCLEWHEMHHSKDHYYETRAKWNDPALEWDSWAAQAAAFIYLNKTCFNGLWRVNKRGEFNVPMGRYKNPAICTPKALREASRALRGTTLMSGDYAAAVATARAGDFLYFDPPYDEVGFVTYTEGGFGRDQQRELATLARALVTRGCHVMLSNNDTPHVRELYAGFQIDQVKCARAINSDASKRGPVDEVIIVGTPPTAGR